MASKSLKIFWRGVCLFLLPVILAFPKGINTVYAAPGDTVRVSVDSSGLQANAITYSGQISADGRFVVFDSDASNLVADDTNGHTDIFLRNLQLGTTVRVSLDANGGQADNGSGASVISADGRFVAFESDASNLAASDANGFVDILVKDTQTGTVSIVSVDSGGGQANGNSSTPSISGDGRYVVFSSDATNLFPNDVNERGDVFLHDRQTGLTTAISAGANTGFLDASISLDGRFVVFASRATNLIAGDTNEATDVFVYTIQTGQITRVSVNSSGEQADKGATEPSISADGRYVTFSSISENLISTDTLGFEYLYVHDRNTGTTTMISFYRGYPMYGHSDSSVISADGSTIVFSYDDKGDSLPTRWLYVYNRITGSMVSVAGGGIDASDSPILPSISGDGRLISFASSSAKLVAGDTNGVRDIFVKEVKYTVDINPTVASSAHGCPNGCISSADQHVDFLVMFSEPVTGVDVSDFVLTAGGGIVGATVTTVSGAGSDYIVRVDTGSGDGTLRLDIIDDDSIKDLASNPLGGAGAGNGNFTAGGVYFVDKSILVVSSVLRVDQNPTVSSSVHFAVNYSEPVTGVNVNDFSLATTGTISGAAVSEVNGSGSAYVVTVNTSSGDGTLRLDILDDDSILDVNGVPLGGTGIGNGNFAGGELYTIDRSAPVVVSVLRMDADPTAAAVVHFNVTFSEPVSGVDGGDFLLTTNGVSNAAITEILFSGNTYFVAVATGTGNGTIRLDVVDNDSIVDAFNFPLGGTGEGSFAVGESYTVTKITYVTMSEKLRSNGENDGWILESKENSDQGYTKNSIDALLNIGDNAANRQYRAILSFPTSYLPDNAVITNAILTIKLQRSVGTDPFTTHGNISVDIRYGPFGSFGLFGIKALQSLDFQAPASMYSVGQIQNNPVGGWYWAVLDDSAFSSINLIGVTQFRLAFQLDDNNDFGDDYLMFYSGDYADQKDRPHLLLEYYVPR